MFKNIVFILAAFFIMQSSFAKGEWNRIVIPGAFCGDGKNYHVFFKERSSEKLLVTFVSGGACWNKSTCYGPNLRTWIHPTYIDPEIPIFAENNNRYDDHSVLYLPYCTGDVFAGRHIAQYKNKKMYHYGAINVEKSLEYLAAHNFIHFNKIDDLMLYGSSAGAIGSLIHSKKIEKLVRKRARKTVIADSPGLHFGRDFWDKFTPKQIDDFKMAFETIDFNAPLDDGFVAPYLKETCRYLKGWEVAVLMGSRDIVMSKVFGDISMREHEDLVYSVDGIAETFRHSENCSVWLKRSPVHMFLLGKSFTKLKVKGLSSLEFIERVHTKRVTGNIIEDKID